MNTGRAFGSLWDGIVRTAGARLAPWATLTPATGRKPTPAPSQQASAAARHKGLVNRVRRCYTIIIIT